ncbi:MAG: DUF6264 family protein [Pseudoclavibacter sp.]
MTIGPAGGGAPGQTPGAPPPDSDEQRKRLRQARRRVDRINGHGLLIFGLFATVINMTLFTENTLAQQFAALFEDYGVEPYARPDGLGTLALVGILGHPVIYAIALYLTLIVWKRDRIAAWVPVVGAIVALLFTGALMVVGVMMHPELLEAAMSMPLGSLPTTTP